MIILTIDSDSYKGRIEIDNDRNIDDVITVWLLAKKLIEEVIE